MLVKCLFLLYFVIGTQSSNDIARSTEMFNADLYNVLKASNKNLVYSPSSIHTLLTLLYEGSARHTQLVLNNFLGLASKSVTAKQYREVLKSLAWRGNTTMEVATKMYVKASFRFKKDFVDVAKRFFSTEAASLNMDNSQRAAEEVNSWVRAKTHGKVTKLVTAHDFTSNTRNVLLNTVYFKADWGFKFNKADTKTMAFYVSPAKTVHCAMMYTSNNFYYRDDEHLDAQILMLPFRNKRFSLVVILPREKMGISEMERDFTKARYTSVTDQQMSIKEVQVYLPKFKIESTHDLIKPLKDLGIEDIFKDTADFSSMLENVRYLKVSKFLHKASIEINEEGGGISAAKVIDETATSPGRGLNPSSTIIFNANHPFLYLLTIKQNLDDFILLMGKVAIPG